MLIQIKNRFTGMVIFQHSCKGNSIAKTITAALLSGVNLSGANLCGVNLSGSNLSGVNFSGVNLSGSNLSGSNLSGADLYNTDLYNTDLSGANLSGADLYNTDFSGSNLSGVNLSGVNLSGSNLSGSNLSGAVLIDGSRVANGSSVIQLGPIGSRRAYLTAYITDKGLLFDAWCQRQITREVFERRLTQEHGENEFAKEYRAALVFLDALVEIRAPKNKPQLI